MRPRPCASCKRPYRDNCRPYLCLGFECNDLTFADGYRSVNPLGTNFITHCKAAFGNVWTLAAREVRK